ncbi:MAG TPA: ATP-grasp domain-containing protein [Streptosporangiaceae bacterium]|nr:ATP-grasp domain-containing protein [Streptosporangiaceae bacterium]
MVGEPAVVKPATGRPGSRSDGYDILILDAGYKQSLASARSLGRAGLRVAMGECFVECDPSRPVLAFQSHYSSCNVQLPSYATDPDGFASAIAEFVRAHPTRVILPTGDAVISTLLPHRQRFAELGSVLAMAPEAALEIALDKDRTLEVARKLGIEQPRTMRIDTLGDLPGVLAEFNFPIVLKPTASWSGHSDHRVQPMEVIDRDEATAVTQDMLAAGSSVLAQEWACGRREGMSLFIANGEVMAACAHAAYRTHPPLGGASVMRESIPMLPDIYDPAVRLAQAIGLEGVCEVEFRRDAAGRALLMEINPRLAGTIENAVHSGVDFPMLIWQWATGQEVDRVDSYRIGVRTHWLYGELRWLQANHRRTGRPDSIPRARALWTIALEMIRTRHYDCFDPHDLGPGLAELRNTAASVLKSRNPRTPATYLPRKEA